MSTTPEHLQADPAEFAPLLFELFSPEARANPYPLYRRHRETNPIHRSPIGLWTLTRYEDVLAVLRDDRFSADPRNSEVFSRFDLQDDDAVHPVREVAGRVLLFTDPPDHTRLRTLVNKAFTRRVVEELRPHIEELVDGLLDEIAGRREIDVIADFAYPLPALVICELMGVPTEDRDRFKGWSGEIAPIIDPLTPPDVMARAVETVGKFGEYFRELVEERRRNPQDDLLTALIRAESDEGRLDEEELLGICVLLFIAGHETTQNLIGNGLLALLRNRDQLETLRGNPSIVKGAIEELLRYDSPVQLTARSALEDIEISGETIPKGEQVVAILGAANRDPAAFDDPERLDLRREKVQVASFGAGAHFCLGAPLARLEGQIAFTKLLGRFGDLELATDEPKWRNTLTLRGLEALEVKL